MKYALNACVIFLITCSLYGCKHQWDWKPDPYVADYQYQSILNADSVEVKCTDPGFNDFTCFTSQNLAELKYNIEQLNIDSKTKNLILTEIEKVIPGAK